MGNIKLNGFYTFGGGVKIQFFYLLVVIKVPFFRVWATMGRVAPCLQLSTIKFLIFSS